MCSEVHPVPTEQEAQMSNKEGFESVPHLIAMAVLGLFFAAAVGGAVVTSAKHANMVPTAHTRY
ncbi:MAG: hypothetical protein Athens041674_698 [Parcubacteria group bacterium Athens0416_74]|nr:MAG: hypothetical protein Athens041674_698 [Parcubacteria group bacterium Athens0416_74]